MIISLELNVGFTSNQAVNLSLSAVKRFIKENLSIWSVDGLWRALFHKGPPRISLAGSVYIID